MVDLGPLWPWLGSLVFGRENIGMAKEYLAGEPEVVWVLSGSFKGCI